MATSHFGHPLTIDRSVEFSLDTRKIEPFRVGLKRICLHTPIWPDPFQYDFGDGQALSNLVNIAQTAFPFQPNRTYAGPNSGR